MEKTSISVPFRSFQNRFKTEDHCRAHLFRLRWPNGFVCPNCGHGEYYCIAKRRLLQCGKCAHQTSVTAGTVMHRTRTPLRVWFWAIYLTANDKRGLSALQLSKNLDVSYYVAWTMLHKIRKAMKDRDSGLESQPFLQLERFISGAGPGGDKTGRGARRTPVRVAVGKRDSRNEFIQMFVMDRRKKGKTSDAGVSANDYDEKTEMVSASEETKDPGTVAPGVSRQRARLTWETKEFSGWIRIISSNARSFLLGTYHGIGGKHLQRYLDEFCYRFNRRYDANIFDRLITACVCSAGLTYTELTL